MVFKVKRSLTSLFKRLSHSQAGYGLRLFLILCIALLGMNPSTHQLFSEHLEKSQDTEVFSQGEHEVALTTKSATRRRPLKKQPAFWVVKHSQVSTLRVPLKSHQVLAGALLPRLKAHLGQNGLGRPLNS